MVGVKTFSAQDDFHFIYSVFQLFLLIIISLFYTLSLYWSKLSKFRCFYLFFSKDSVILDINMTYNQLYKTKNVWGDKPNDLLFKVYNKVEAGSRFLDLGCGQGRDSLFMLREGFQVTAVDSSLKGLESIKNEVAASELPQDRISLFCEDIVDFTIKENDYTIINIFNALQFLLKTDAIELIHKSKKALRDKGYIIIAGFMVDDPSYLKMSDKKCCFFEQQELKKIFSDFQIVFYEEKKVLDKGHQGSPEPHIHSVVKKSKIMF